MGMSEIQLTPTGAIGVQSAIQTVERGRLVALSILWAELPPVWPQAYVRAGIVTPDTPIGNLTVQLASGYLDFRTGPTWTGDILLTIGMRLVLLANTIQTTPIRLAWITEE